VTNQQGKALVEAFQADQWAIFVHDMKFSVRPGCEGSEPACRCYRCGVLLTAREVREDRGAWGVRPVCRGCVASAREEHG